MKKTILSLVSSVIVLSVLVIPSNSHAQYGAGSSFTPVSVPSFRYGGRSFGVPAGRVLGASTFSFNKDLWFGMNNSDVVELQNKLKTLGFFTFPTSTGYFGPITLAAVKALQTANGIPATGYVGSLTRAALNK